MTTVRIIKKHSCFLIMSKIFVIHKVFYGKYFHLENTIMQLCFLIRTRTINKIINNNKHMFVTNSDFLSPQFCFHETIKTHAFYFFIMLRIIIGLHFIPIALQNDTRSKRKIFIFSIKATHS